MMRMLPAVLVFLALSTSHAQDPVALDIPSGIYAIDKGHTYVTFSYLHQGLSYPLLRATAVDGELDLDADAIGNSSVAIAIEADSIRSNVDYFDEELASAKFFNAAKFPHLSYVGHGLDMDGPVNGVLKGAVTIRGITRPLDLDITINGAMENPLSGKPVIGVSATGALNRSDFELDRFIPDVSDRVTIAIEVEFAMGSSEESRSAAATARSAAGAVGD